MKKSLTKLEAENKIESFFKNLEDKTPEEVKKIKRLGKSYNIKLKDKRKKSCKYCFSPFTSKNSKTQIKNNMKVVKCLSCSKINRWKI